MASVEVLNEIYIESIMRFPLLLAFGWSHLRDFWGCSSHLVTKRDKPKYES